MPERDVVCLMTMISGYSNVGRVEELRVLFERMGLEGLGEAFSLFRKMSEEGSVPDVATWNAMISGFVQS
ncbi:hypothetical protein CTI12_AA433320 [Artemisia annua]|uniref:Pentatricopeptide repeat-containing protein n=1 Tax=Artemisia annua TaxID=35608 RepID=A0A2U1LZ89_ARTAN|nr:hypothetical protein CTI12_AA433320 [Artemisia annua]